MRMCPNEHLHFVMLAVREGDRPAMIYYMAQLIAWLSERNNEMPRPQDHSITMVDSITASKALREDAKRYRRAGEAQPETKEAADLSARGLEAVADIIERIGDRTDALAMGL